MRLITIGTGSSGNCYLLQRDNGHYIALDCGCPWNSVMVGCGFRPSDIDFALVTHSHNDHSKHVKTFAKNGIDVYGEWNIAPLKSRMLGDVKVIAFNLPHDVNCYGYLIDVDGHRVIYMTDFEYCKYTFSSWQVDTWIIACNHVEAPDAEEVKYAHVVMGHSSLETVKGILMANRNPEMRNIILVHYSADADTDRMVNEVQETVGKSAHVSLARKGQVTDIL